MIRCSLLEGIVSGPPVFEWQLLCFFGTSYFTSLTHSFLLSKMGGIMLRTPLDYLVRIKWNRICNPLLMVPAWELMFLLPMFYFYCADSGIPWGLAWTFAHFQNSSFLGKTSLLVRSKLGGVFPWSIYCLFAQIALFFVLDCDTEADQNPAVISTPDGVMSYLVSRGRRRDTARL